MSSNLDDLHRQLHKWQENEDRRRGWEKHGYPGFGEIVIGLIIFFTLVAIIQSHH